MKRFPSLCTHRRTGRAYATDPATGKQIQFGLAGTKEAEQAYQRWIGSLAARRVDVASGAPPGMTPTISELIADYHAWAKKYYVKRGRTTTEFVLIEKNSDTLLRLFAGELASSFGPTQLKAVRSAYIAENWNRQTINNQMSRLTRMFRWGVEHELIRPEQLVALRAVKGLARGRCEARESKPILPVSAEHVRKAAAKCKGHMRAMLLIHLATGMRSGELVEMAVSRIDTTKEPWQYIPTHHKNEHRGKERFIYLGPEARELLLPWLNATKQRGGERIWLTRDRGHMTVDIYSANIQRACERAGVPRFRPLQIRHRAATSFREAAGIEGAQALLGHSHLKTTEIYAEQQTALARDTIEKIG